MTAPKRQPPGRDDLRRARRRVSTAASRSLFMAVASAACIHHTPVVDMAPHIDAIRPDTVLLPVGSFVDVTIVGRGFVPGSPGANTIELAGAVIASVPANADGTSIRFMVPDVLPSRTEAPPMRLAAGTYDVRVTNTTGASNTVTLTVRR